MCYSYFQKACKMKFISAFLLSFVAVNIYAQHPIIPSESPKLVIGIVVSEMRYDYLNRYWDKFGEGGFRRLVNEGSVCKNAYHDYLIAESSPGFATLGTGAYPSEHGMVSDYWYNRLGNTIEYSISDSHAETIGGLFESGKYSPRSLNYSTLSDELKVSSKFGSKVISVSLDPVGSVISGGHTADASYWYDPETGNWITSNYYVDSLNNWVKVFNEKGFADLYLQKKWETLMPLNDYAESLADSSPYETGIRGKTEFPYDLAEMSKKSRNEFDFSLLREVPFGNTLTTDFAIGAVMEEELGKDEITDWLHLNFAVGAYLGKKYSSWSVEMEDMYLRLDKDIEHFLEFVDAEIGMENVLVYLTAENAAAHDPDYLMDRRIPSGYFNYNSALSLLKSYLNVIYGKGKWIKFYYAKQIFINRDLIEDSKLSMVEVQDRIARFMVQFEGVSTVLTSENLMKNNYTTGAFERIQKSYNQKRSGDVILHLTPGWTEKAPDRKLASSYHYDTHVPLIFYGWQIGREEISREISVVDLMPTMAWFLNISRPVSMQGKIIGELLD